MELHTTAAKEQLVGGMYLSTINELLCHRVRSQG